MANQSAKEYTHRYQPTPIGKYPFKYGIFFNKDIEKSYGVFPGEVIT